MASTSDDATVTQTDNSYEVRMTFGDNTSDNSTNQDNYSEPGFVQNIESFFS